jgi:hypothetical protein
MRLAETWNANAAGTLWTRDWFQAEDGSFRSRGNASGVFGVPDRIYEDEEAFWTAFEADRSAFFGRRLNNDS